MSFSGDWSPEEAEAALLEELGGYDVGDRAAGAAAAAGDVVNWRELEDSRTPEVWTDLRGWVEWFTVRYQLSTSMIPNCWWRHGRLVEELSALRSAHRALFSDEDSGLGPIGWHERLTLSLQRIKDVSNGYGCSSGHVEKKSARDWSAVDDADEWEAWITQGHGNR